MKITTKTNGYTIGNELNTMKEKFEYAANTIFPNWEVEHFYYGNKLIMTTIRGNGCEYADFNITANRVSFNGHTLSRTNYKKCELLTHNDELYNGKLLELCRGWLKMKQSLYNWLVVIIFVVAVGLAGTSDIAQYI